MITQDTALDLAGLPVRAVRVPGHTFGSMAWRFEKGGKRYVATGDLIMPDGVLGYSGSINFSAADVLSSLRKLQALKPDVVLPGHGPYGDPDRYLAAGIAVGVHVGWGKLPAGAARPLFPPDAEERAGRRLEHRRGLGRLRGHRWRRTTGRGRRRAGRRRGTGRSCS